MLKIRSNALHLALIAAAVVGLAPGGARAADSAADKQKEKELIAVIRSDAPPQDKAVPCKLLAIYGSAEAVPALAALLPDKDLCSWARIALEAIPGPAADDALRQAMAKLQGRNLIGVINSIGVRRDAEAVDALAKKLGEADPAVASAAAAALGRIGGKQAIRTLVPALATAPPSVRTVVAEGCILCAERLLAEGESADAIRLYYAVRTADVPKQRVLEATRGEILAQGPGGASMLIKQLRSTDEDFFAIGLRTARELPGAAATDALVAELAKAPPARRAPLLVAISDRGDAKALPVVLKAAESGPADVRIVAIGVLERLGDASCVPLLLDAAVADDANVAQAAKRALARLPGRDVETDLVALMSKGPAAKRRVLIEVTGQRQLRAAIPKIVACVQDPDVDIRATAVGVLGAVGGGEQIPDLVAVIQKTSDAKDRTALEKALMAIGARAGAGCIGQLMPLAKHRDPALRVAGLHALASAGGPDALAAVVSALDDRDEAVRDEAVRTLSAWPSRWPEDVAATKPLLALAESSKSLSHKVLALRGYLQFVQSTKTAKPAERLAMAQKALSLATRREEKRLVISAVSAVSAPGALDMLVSLAADPAITEEACTSIVNLLTGRGGLRGAPKQQRQKALQAVVEKTGNKGLKKKAEDALKAIK